MELSAEEFARIVNLLGGMPPSDGAVGHRRATRVGRQVQLPIVPIVDGRARTAVTGRVKNLSSRGIGFIRDRRMKAGSQFLIRLPREELGPVELLCTVVHGAQQSVEIWSIGAEFTCVAPMSRADDAPEADRIRQSMLG
jgi:hypothetical protein